MLSNAGASKGGRRLAALWRRRVRFCCCCCCFAFILVLGVGVGVGVGIVRLLFLLLLLLLFLRLILCLVLVLALVLMLVFFLSSVWGALSRPGVRRGWRSLKRYEGGCYTVVAVVVVDVPGVGVGVVAFFSWGTLLRGSASRAGNKLVAPWRRRVRGRAHRACWG